MSGFGKDRSFGRHVQNLRVRRGLTQEALSERAGLSADTVRRLEHGTFSPSLDTLIKLCVGLNLSLSTLFRIYESDSNAELEAELIDLFLAQPQDARELALSVLGELFGLLDQRSATVGRSTSPVPTPVKPSRSPATTMRAAKRAVKLSGLADRIEERAQRVLSTKRPGNTYKRATEAARARLEARQRIAMAAAMRRVAKAVETGELRYMSRVRAGVHVELIDLALRQAMWTRQQEQRLPAGDDRRPERADIEWASFPHPHAKPAELIALVDAAATIPDITANRDVVSTLGARGAPVYLEDPEELAAVTKLLDAVRKTSKLSLELTQLADAIRDVGRLRQLGITDTASLREALHEYLDCCGDALVVEVESSIEVRKRELRFAKIPGYIPTPPTLAKRLVCSANIEAGMRVLEPSAGTGALATVVRERHPDAALELVERHPTMREILRDDGFELVGEDFTRFEPSAPYDRIVMNPPFERRQDVAHIGRALKMLVPGGRLVALAAGGFWQRKDAATAALRGILSELEAKIIELPRGSFQESGTNAVAVMIIVDAAPAR